MTNGLYAATRKGLFKFERSGGTGTPWKIVQSSFVGDNVTLIHCEPGKKRVHAALDHGHFGVKMHRSDDGGVNWEEKETPAYPEKPEGMEDVEPFRKEPTPWTTKLVWSFASGTPKQNGRLWCGTIPGGLFRSDDGGDSWQLNRALWYGEDRKKWFGGGADWPGIHSILVDPRDGKHVVVGVSCGGVWETRDDGETWKQGAQGMRAEFTPPGQEYDPDSQDPHCIVANAENPDVMWCQHHNGIFRTTEGCGHWEEIKDVKPSVFGFGVAVHPKDSNTAYFVPAVKDMKRHAVGGQVVVTRTRDGGKTFQTLREGLPQEHAYDLVYRHALDIDSTGDVLAFGSTTGSVWISDDQGESFQHAAGHLPPVYAMRFERN